MRRVQGSGTRPADLAGGAAPVEAQGSLSAEPGALGAGAVEPQAVQLVGASAGSARVRVPYGVLAMRAGAQELLPRKMIGVVAEAGGWRVLQPLDGSAARPLVGGDGLAPGAVVEVVTKPGAPQVELTDAGTLAAPGSAKARLYDILARHGIDPSFPPEVEEEVQHILQNPGLEDPQLEDLTALPFITIDNEGSRDLDQAMYIEPTAAGGYRVFYALADAAYYVRPGSALYQESIKRGVTYYLPGLAVPMLPPELSEGMVSLNEGVERRALTLVTELDAQGKVLGTEVRRTKIRSQKKLTYEGVQAYFDQPAGHALAGQPYTETLQLLKKVGELRMRDAEERDVVRINRVEVRHGLDPSDPRRFVTSARGRIEVEKWNEQLSLLTNSEGAKLMEAEGNAPHVTPIYRIHPEPVGKRLADFRQRVAAAARAHGLEDDTWRWKNGQSLADFLARLPEAGPHARLAAAIQRQAVMVNMASEFSVAPGRHHGVGAEPYARFSSPMRELVGIFTHKEALEKLGYVEPEGWPFEDPLANQAEVVEVANRTRKLQARIEKEADLLVLDQHLQADLQEAPEARRVWRGTIMGLTPTKVYIQMDDPPFEVKLYLSDLAERFDTELALDETGAVARSVNPEALGDFRLGDEVALRLDRLDAGKQRYVFTPLIENGAPRPGKR